MNITLGSITKQLNNFVLISAFVGTSAFFGATGEIGWNVAGGLMGGTVALFAVFAVVMNICARFSRYG